MAAVEIDWQQSANCIVESPEDTSFIRKPDTETAKKWELICRKCLVARQCLEWADANNVVGVFAAGEWRD